LIEDLKPRDLLELFINMHRLKHTLYKLLAVLAILMA
jgi:hypothetical protein